MTPAGDAEPLLRVVLVDDTPDIRLLLRVGLEAGGRLRVVGEAGDGAEGVDVVTRTRPDLVLVDLAMPVRDGLQALPALRRACPSARLVVHSGFEGSRILPRARAAGADAYLQKGLDPWALEERLLEIARGDEGPPLDGRDPAEVGVRGPGPINRTAGEGSHPAPAAQDDPVWLRTAVAAAVHEIRNPTVVIAGAVATLLGTGPDGARPPDGLRDELLAAVARQTRLLDRATADLLAATQTHRGDVPVDPRPLVLAELLAAAVTDTPGSEHVTLDCPPRLVVHADPLRVQQMVLNLLSNAAKYGAPPVTVRACPDGDRVQVTVTDAGPGVPAALAPTLFEEFARAPATGAPGTGLGLFVVRSLARAQGGRAWYEGGPDGAVFAFTLPSAPPPQAGAPPGPLDAVGTAR